MKKTILAVAIASLSSTAMAVELYNNDGTTFAVGGHVSVNLNGSEQGDTGVGSNSPRINFTATQDLGNGFTADARGEWQLNYLNGGDNSFTTRLGYVGLTHEDFGRAVAGTQWAPYYDVAGVADMPIAFANDFIYDNHGVFGTGRGENMISYRNGVELGEAGALDFGFAWQGQQSDELQNIGAVNFEYDVKDRVQATASYSIMGAKLGYAYNTGEIKNATFGKGDATSHVVSAAYGSYGKGLYLAGVYASNENMNSVGRAGTVKSSRLLEESTAYEFLAAYALPNSLNFSINYEMVEGKQFKAASTKETTREEMALQVEYNFKPNFVGYTAYQFDLNDKPQNVKVDTNDMWVIGARIYL
ncbi:porin [Vibrio scophthalmi]|uniref:porin n=1 Tax=Vibrio scophthalmi TaxID=45658 RepID=UPI002FEEE67B